MFKVKQRLAVMLAVVFTAFLLVSPAGAAEILGGDIVSVPEGKRIQGPLFITGNMVVINADVDGDVFALGQDVIINGRINGDLLAAAKNITINGTVSGDARCAAAGLQVKGEIKQSATAFAAGIRQFESSSVGRDILAFSEETVLSGSVGREVLGAGERVLINGEVGGDASLWQVGSLKLGPQASIAGNIFYRSAREAEVAPGSKIDGKLQWEQIEVREKPQPPQGMKWLSQVAWFAAGVLVWGALALVFPGVWFNLSRNVIGSPLSALGWGLVLLLITPLAALLLLVTVIGIPLSVAVMTAYGMLIYGGKIIIGDTAGRYFAERFGWGGRVHPVLPFMLGFAGLILLTNIPVAGLLINIAVTCAAIGAVFLALRGWRQGRSAIG